MNTETPRIYLPKYKTIDLGNNRGPTLGHARNSYAGEVRAVKYNSMGQVNQDTGWCSNLLLNQGLDYLYTQGWANMTYRFAVGDSNAGTSYTQTGLQGTYLGYSQSTNGTADVTYTYPTYPYESYTIRNRRFAAGVATGTIREVVMTFTIGNPGSTAAIRCVLPVEIVKASDETVDIFYKWWRWVDFSDVTGTVTVEGLVYDWTHRPYAVQPPQYSLSATTLGTFNWVFATDATAYGVGAALIPYTSLSGWGGTGWANQGTTTEFYSTYTPGSHQIDEYVDIGLNSFNTGTGIQVIANGSMSPRSQTRFGRQGGGDETIPKDGTRVIEGLTWRFTWARSALKARPMTYNITGVDIGTSVA